MQKLPPLNTLRAFRVAAATLSFTEAAEQLFVTQAAVSHQIKALEEFLPEEVSGAERPVGTDELDDLF